MSSSLRTRSLLPRLASLCALGAGALLLLADSSDPSCENGYNALRFAARFTSTCPANFAPPSGTLRIDLPNDGREIVEPLRIAGVFAVGQVDTDGRSVCTPTSLRIAGLLTCSSIDLSPLVGSQTITCSSDRTSPAVLKLHTIDSGAGADATDQADATDRADATDATVASEGGPPTSRPPPSNSPVTCTIVFEQVR